MTEEDVHPRAPPSARYQQTDLVLVVFVVGEALVDLCLGESG
jgi:hypothetical protein